jgi:hypothetical protein
MTRGQSLRQAVPDLAPSYNDDSHVKLRYPEVRPVIDRRAPATRAAIARR